MRENEPDSSLPLESAPVYAELLPDRRARMEEPPPVRLVAVEDVRVEAAAGLERDLDAFYASLLQFVKEYADGDVIVYGAENFRILMKVAEPPMLRDDLRPVIIEIASLSDLGRKLSELKIEFEYVQSLLPGSECILLRDPAGNWVQIMQWSRVE